MSLLTTITRFASNVRTRHRQARTLMFVSSLPFDIQKDIGWPDINEKRAANADEPRR